MSTHAHPKRSSSHKALTTAGPVSRETALERVMEHRAAGRAQPVFRRVLRALLGLLLLVVALLLLIPLPELGVRTMLLALRRASRRVRMGGRWIRLDCLALEATTTLAAKPIAGHPRHTQHPATRVGGAHRMAARVRLIEITAGGRIGRFVRTVGALSLSVLALVAIAPAGYAARQSRVQYFLSMGDSYAVGYQDSVGSTTLNGPANQLLSLARARDYRFKLVQLGCPGATSGSMITCPGAYRDMTQVQAAVAFMRKHPGQVGLVTISIGGDILTPCIPLPDRVACVRTAMKTVSKNVRTIVKQLRVAGGKKLRIVGSTYPDVLLGAWVGPDVFGTAGPTIAAESLTMFARLINPGLRNAYASVGGKFVDVTRATGAYGPFVTTNDPPYGER